MDIQVLFYVRSYRLQAGTLTVHHRTLQHTQQIYHIYLTLTVISAF